MLRSDFLKLLLGALLAPLVQFLPKKEEPVVLGWHQEWAHDVYTSPDGNRWFAEELELIDALDHRTLWATRSQIREILEARP